MQTLYIETKSENKTETREQLILKNRGLVVDLVTKMFSNSYEYDDLVAEGMLLLIEAIDSYENTEVQLSTFIHQHVKFGLMKCVYGGIESEISVDHKSFKTIKKIKKTISRLEQRYFRPPTVAEIAEEMKLPLKKVHTFMQREQLLECVDIDEVSPEQISTIENSDVEPDEMYTLIDDSLRRLEDTDREVIIRLFGLQDSPEHSCQQIIEDLKLGIKKAAFSIKRKKLLQKMRDMDDGKLYAHYLELM